jgi:hypothetical protein
MRSRRGLTPASEAPQKLLATVYYGLLASDHVVISEKYLTAQCHRGPVRDGARHGAKSAVRLLFSIKIAVVQGGFDLNTV